MDPDANLQEQERLLRQPRRLIADRRRLSVLRVALWSWLRRRGYEPRWSECPQAAVHFKSYGGSNVAGWKAALLLCLLLQAAAGAQVRTVYTDRDPATGQRFGGPVAVQVHGPARQVPAEALVALKAREFVAVPEWDGPHLFVTADVGPDWPLPPGTQVRARLDTWRWHAARRPVFTFTPYGRGHGLPYGPAVFNAKGVHGGSRRR